MSSMTERRLEPAPFWVVRRKDRTSRIPLSAAAIAPGWCYFHFFGRTKRRRIGRLSSSKGRRDSRNGTLRSAKCSQVRFVDYVSEPHPIDPAVAAGPGDSADQSEG